METKKKYHSDERYSNHSWNSLYSFFKILFLLTASPLFSQNNNFRFDHITVDNGLSQNYIMHIFQDSKGFLWIATQDGLNRYDGYKFKTLRHIPGNPNSIPDFSVNRLCEDNEGNIWIGTREGLARYDPVYETYTVFKNDPANPNSLVNNSIWALKKDHSGKIWIGTGNGISIYNKEKNNFTNFLNDPSDSASLSSNRVTFIEEDKNNQIWIATVNGLNKYNSEKKIFNRYFHNPEDDKSLSSSTVLSIELTDDIMWLATRDGLNKAMLSDKELSFVKYYHDPNNPNTISSNQVTSIISEGNNYLWVGTTDGLNRFDTNTGSFYRYVNSESDIESISENSISKLFIDRSRVLWIGTFESGLNKVNLSGEKFLNFSKRPGSNNSLSSSSVQTIFEDNDGTIWAGTENGVNKISNHGKSNESVSYLNDAWLNSTNIYTITRDSYGDLWIGTFGGGITKINGKTNQPKFYFNDDNKPGSLSNNFIHCIYEDNDKNIWIGTGVGGVNKYIRNTDSFISYMPVPGDSNSLRSNEVASILKDKRGNLWFGTTTAGVSRFDPVKNKYTNYVHKTEDLKSLGSNRIVTLFEDNKGRIWIGTVGGGLNLFDYNSESFTYFTVNDGLPENTVNTLAEDNKGNLWIGTNKGISKFNVEQKTFKNYDMNDGLPGNEFVKVYKSRISNNIFFGGKKGLSIFNPDKVKDDTTVPEIAITDFSVFNKSVHPGENSILKKNILYSDELTISYSDNIFSFEFAALHFANPQKNKFAYMLEGFDKDWIYSGTRNFATYTNLDPGDYIFRVKGSNGDGVWNEEGESVRLFVSPPVYRTWWAYILYAGLIAFAFFAVRKYEMNKVRLRNELRLKEFEAKKFQEVDQLKSRFFANISHEFRTPLTIILGSLDKLKMKSTDKLNLKDYEVMKRNAARLLQLINQLLELSKIEAGSSKLLASRNDLIKFLRRVIASFSSIAQQKKLGLYFNGSPSSIERNLEELFIYFDKEKLETVFYNLLSNAVKFTPEGERIDIEVYINADTAEIKFTNTGVEIPQDKFPDIFTRFFQVDDSGTRSFEGTGIGLALVKELVELHKGKIKAESRNLKTSFIISLPLGKSHLNDEELTEDIVLKREGFEKVHPLIADSEKLLSEEKVKPHPDSAKPHSDSTIVLIVEDNPDLREFLSEHLEEEYSVVEAENGLKGLSLAEEIIPDLIISDIMMPVMDGYELCRSIKTNEKTSHIPLILLTARAETKDKLEGLETGADDYLVKPFNPDELKVRVRNLIKIRREMREKFSLKMLVKPADVIVPSTQKVFLDKLISIIEENLEKDKFTIEILCDKIGMSRAQLHRKVKAITNQTTTEFIRNFRLQRAADLIKQDAGNMAEIAYKVGFNSQAYFNKSFQEFFGCSPTEFKKQNLSEAKYESRRNT